MNPNKVIPEGMVIVKLYKRKEGLKHPGRYDSAKFAEGEKYGDLLIHLPEKSTYYNEVMSVASAVRKHGIRCYLHLKLDEEMAVNYRVDPELIDRFEKARELAEMVEKENDEQDVHLDIDGEDYFEW